MNECFRPLEVGLGHQPFSTRGLQFNRNKKTQTHVGGLIWENEDSAEKIQVSLRNSHKYNTSK